MNKLIEERINVLKKLDLSTVDCAFLENQVRELLGVGYVSRLLQIRYPIIYRARINDTNGPFENTRKLWWPKPECIKERGRLNDVGESVFYFSDSENTAIIEKQPKLGDVVTVIEAELVDQNKMPLVVELGLPEFTGKSNPNYGGLAPESDFRQMEFMEREGISQTNPLLRNYLVSEFMKSVAVGHEHEYKTTIAIARILMAPGIIDDNGRWVSDIEIDGLSYPSIAAENLGANTAIRKESADRLYRPARCTAYRVQERSSDTHYQVGELMKSSSIETDGTINWVVTGRVKASIN